MSITWRPVQVVRPIAMAITEPRLLTVIAYEQESFEYRDGELPTPNCRLPNLNSMKLDTFTPAAPTQAGLDPPRTALQLAAARLGPRPVGIGRPWRRRPALARQGCVGGGGDHGPLLRPVACGGNRRLGGERQRRARERRGRDDTRSSRWSHEHRVCPYRLALDMGAAAEARRGSHAALKGRDRRAQPERWGAWRRIGHRIRTGFARPGASATYAPRRGPR